MVQHKQQHKSKHNWNLEDVILFESGSTIKVTFMNHNLFANIKPIKSTLYVFTNSGTKKIAMQGGVKKY